MDQHCQEPLVKTLALPQPDRGSIIRPGGLTYYANETSGTILTKVNKCASIEHSTHDPKGQIHLRRSGQGRLS